MKKYLTAMLSFVILVVGCFMLTACGEVKLLKAYVEDGTIKTTLTVNETLDTSNVVAHFEFSNKTKVEVAANNLTFSNVDTSTTGEKTLTITYGKYSFNITITVVESGEVVEKIDSFSSDLLVDFNTNRGVSSTEQNGFKLNNKPLYVGDDNAFNFRINAKVRDNNFDLVPATVVNTTIKVELKDGETYTELTGADLEAKVSINDQTNELDFTQAAVGSVFRVTVTAVNYNTAMFDNAPSFTTELKVVDGWNVYNAKDLSLFDNGNRRNKEWAINAWAAKKQANNLAGVTTNGIILQDTINVTKNDIPQEFFYDANHGINPAASNLPIEGSLKDGYELNIYERNTTEPFNFYGNYFQVDASKLPRAVVGVDDLDKGIIVSENAGEGRAITMHTTLFAIDSVEQSKHNATFSDVSLLGNGKRTDDVTYSGGILMLKTYETNVTADNIIFNDFFIGYFPIESGKHGVSTLKNSKGYNCYSSILYAYGAHEFNVINCDLIGAGGPVIVAEHNKSSSSNGDYNPSTGEGGEPAHINFVGGKLESYITGNEPWFATYHAETQIAQIKALNDVFFGANNIVGAPYHDEAAQASLLKNQNQVPMLNAIAFYKLAGSFDFAKYQPLKGYIRLFDNETDYNAYYNNNDATKTFGLEYDKANYAAASIPTSLSAIAGNYQTPVFESVKGGFIFPTSADFSTNQNTCAMGLKYYSGSHVNFYLPNGMGAVLGLHHNA